MSELVCTFSARDDHGNEYTINGYAERIGIPNRGGDRHKLGKTTLETDDGQTVSYIEQGKYEIVDSGIKLISDDPNAV